MKLLIHLVRPKHMIPIHGELRQLKQHGAIARQLGIPAENVAVVENGMQIEFADGRMTLADRVPGNYVFVDGTGVGDIGPSVMRERELLARDGFVSVQLRVRGSGGALVEKPEIISKGFVYVREAGELLAGAEQTIREAVARGGASDLGARVENALSEYFYSETKRRPMVFVSVTAV
jgi:ribonuclease J